MALALFDMLEDARDCLGLGDFADHTKSPPTVGTHTERFLACHDAILNVC